jgi:MoaA/NifB/PqqE/SkfB family radical SAM enzyme
LKYGKEGIDDFVLTYNISTVTESEKDRILMSCINLGMSDIQMKALFHVGSGLEVGLC